MKKLFNYSPLDFILFLIILFELFFSIMAAIYWNELSLLTKISWIATNAFLIATNYQCVAHNIIHTPFFKFNALNNLTSILNSMCLGMPQTLYYEHHMNHHRYNNDPIDPETGTTKDHSSLYRHGKNGKVENIVSYSVLGIIRSPIDLFAKSAISKGHGKLLTAEVLGQFLFWGILTKISLSFFLTGVLSSWVLGQMMAFAENYLEHLGAKPNDRKRDSVSCYNPLYNFIWFNNGYHQEHHYKPTVHWSEIQKVRSELPTDRKILKIAHWLNL